MKLYLFFLLLLTLTARAQTPAISITIGTIDSVYSKILGEKRKIWVYVPEEKPAGIYLPQRYPVVYLLDGDAHFNSVVGMIQQLSEVNSNTIVPKMIVVGINNTNRVRDFTPTHSIEMPFGQSDFFRTSGGGEQFTEFLRSELIPHIDSLYPTAPYHTLMGHSLGGLFVTNALLNHTNLFNAYLAIDPSLWWDNRKLVKQAATVLNQKNFKNKTFYLAIANTLSRDISTAQMRKDTSRYSEPVRSAFQFADLLKSASGNGLVSHSQYYDKDDHRSVPLIGTYDALRFIFKEYSFFIDDRVFFGKDNKLDAAVESHFKTVSQHMNYTVLPPEPYVNGIGYALLAYKQVAKAEALFLINVRNYPTSANVYDSLADCYMAKDDKEKAKEYYTKALTIKEMAVTREKLQKLTAEK